MEYRELVPKLNSEIRFLSEGVGEGTIERGDDAANVALISGDDGDASDRDAVENSGLDAMELSRGGRKSFAEKDSDTASSGGEAWRPGELTWPCGDAKGDC